MRIKGNNVSKVLSAWWLDAHHHAEETDGGERAFWAFRQHVVGGMDEKFQT